MTTRTEPQITFMICNPRHCPKYGDHKHRWTERVSLGTYPNGNSTGESVACKCGQDAFSLSLMTDE